MDREIVTIATKPNEKFLRAKTKEFDFSAWGKKELAELISSMRRIMRREQGIGLAANQIGYDFRMFVAEVPDSQGGTKFYAVFNPSLEKKSEELDSLEEGCLSVPGKYGEVRRAARLTLKGFDRYGKPLTVKAWGLLARVFQHEVDHLNGALFIDKAEYVEEAPHSKRLREREGTLS